jgi:hypothetical protein
MIESKNERRIEIKSEWSQKKGERSTIPSIKLHQQNHEKGVPSLMSFPNNRKGQTPTTKRGYKKLRTQLEWDQRQ